MGDNGQYCSEHHQLFNKLFDGQTKLTSKVDSLIEAQKDTNKSINRLFDPETGIYASVQEIRIEQKRQKASIEKLWAVFWLIITTAIAYQLRGLFFN